MTEWSQSTMKQMQHNNCKMGHLVWGLYNCFSEKYAHYSMYCICAMLGEQHVALPFNGLQSAILQKNILISYFDFGYLTCSALSSLPGLALSSAG